MSNVAFQDIEQLFVAIEDYVVPRLKLDVGEARLYYHLLRHSRIVGKHDALFSIAQISEVLNCSKNTVKPRLRKLQEKKVIEILNTGWAGTRIRVFIPTEIPNAIPDENSPDIIDIEAIDFYKDSRYRPAIIEREEGHCFYCRRMLTAEDSGLDHIEPQIMNGTNSYRNVVAACHSCNSSKGDNAAEDFLRNLYRRGFIGADELEKRLSDIEKLKQGLLRPII